MRDPIYLDNHLIAVYKPFGILTQSDRPGGDSLLGRTKDWLKTRFNKPGKVFLGLVHRLDRPVAGVVLFARTSKAASRLSQQFRNRTIIKIYQATVIGLPKLMEGRLTGWLMKNQKTGKATVFSKETEGATKAELDYRVAKTLGKYAILEIVLRTGRFHQIRAQLAFMKHPVVGDVKYGAPCNLPNRHIALYSSRIEIKHPISGKDLVLRSPEPTGWPFTA
tara:strand:+ start:350 stop:1012 length:663 start_codon:yes stop_codon:yes gene_type:complete